MVIALTFPLMFEHFNRSKDDILRTQGKTTLSSEPMRTKPVHQSKQQAPEKSARNNTVKANAQPTPTAQFSDWSHDDIPVRPNEGDGSGQQDSSAKPRLDRSGTPSRRIHVPQPSVKRPFMNASEAVATGPSHSSPVNQSGQATVQLRAAQRPSPSATSIQNTAASGVTGASVPLPHLGAIQKSFGRHDVTKVKAYMGGPARNATETMGAEAYAMGNRAAFKRAPDLHTTAHEAAHIIQQRAGISLKSNVGQVGDVHERHADAVADLVVQGKSAEHLLNQYSGTGGHGKQPRKKGANVQMLFGWGKKTEHGKKAAQRKGRHLEHSKKFEKALGTWLYNHPRSKVAADNMVAAVTKSMGKEEGHSEFKDQYKQMFGAEDSEGKRKGAGQVANDFDVIKQAMRQGNLREKMTGLYNAHGNHFKQQTLDLMRGSFQRGQWDEMERRGYDVKKMKRRKRQMRKPWVRDLYRNPHNPIDRKSNWIGTHTWAYGSRTAHPEGEQETKRTAVDLEHEGIGLSEREKAFMTADPHDSDAPAEDPGPRPVQPTMPASSDYRSGTHFRRATRQYRRDRSSYPRRLKTWQDKQEASRVRRQGTTARRRDLDSGRTTLGWKEGGTVFKPNEKNRWVKKCHDELKLPVVAGPSGTTLRFFQMWEFLKKPCTGPDLRAALLGYMLTGNDHSFNEIMMMAAQQGGPAYKADRLAYHTIEPFTEDEIRAGVKLPFPDEAEYLEKHGGMVSHNEHNSATNPNAGPNSIVEPIAAGGQDGEDAARQLGLGPGGEHGISLAVLKDSIVGAEEHFQGGVIPDRGKMAHALAVLLYSHERGQPYVLLNNVLKGHNSKLFMWGMIQKDPKLKAAYDANKFNIKELLAEVTEHARMLKLGFKHLKDHTGTTLWRGYKSFFKPKRGQKVAWNKVQSFSEDKSVAEGFRDKEGGMLDRWKILVKLPPGNVTKPGKKMGVLTSNPQEDEVLFPPEASFKITDVQQVGEATDKSVEVELTQQ